MSRTRVAPSPLLGALLLLALPNVVACGHTVLEDWSIISGRVVDPEHLMTDDAILMIGTGNESSFAMHPVPMESNGSFRTRPLPPATYVLEVIRSPHSPTAAAATVGLSIVTLGTSDVSNVTVLVHPDLTIQGRFRMESDEAGAEWPTHMTVVAALVLQDGTSVAHTVGALGAPGGRFVLHNVFGARILRCGYELAPGSAWWPTKVLLDGVDITNTPTDFGTAGNGRLEVVFTRHPAQLAGTVTDARGEPGRYAWVVVFPADRTLWRSWSTMLQAVKTDANGAFRVTATAGHYLVRALSPDALPSDSAAFPRLGRIAEGAMTVDLDERERKVLRLTTGGF
jgi:hypothetical protein